MITMFIIFSLFFSTDEGYIRGIYISSNVLSYRKNFERLLNKIDNGDFNRIVIDMRDDKGYLYIPKDSTIVGYYASYPFNMDSLVFELHKKGYTVSARIVCMKDYTYTSVDTSYLLKNEDGSVFTDSIGACFLNPSSDKVREMLKKVAAKCAEIGFDDVQLDYIRYPTEGKLDSVDMPDLKDRVEYLTDVIKGIDDTLSFYGVSLSLDVFGFLMWYDVLAVPSQSWYDFSPFCDYIHPMVYPSHYPKNYAYILNKYYRTYRIINNSIKHALNMSVHFISHLRVVPYLQAFDYRKSWMGEFFISQQIFYTELTDAGGYILYHPSFGYPDEAFIYPYTIKFVLPYIRYYNPEYRLGMDRRYRYGIYKE